MALGIAAALLNRYEVALLTEETPLFIFGGFLAYFAVARLGTGPGVLAAAVMVAPFFLLDPIQQVHPGLAVGIGFYVLEAAAVGFLYRRVGSLVLAAAMFWFGAGWLLDAVVFRAWVGLDPAYVLLLLVKQILNGVANAAVAEILLTAPVARWLPGRLGGPVHPGSIRSYVFNRMMLVAGVPTVVLGLLYARARFQDDLATAQATSLEVAVDALRGVEDELDGRSAALARAAKQIQAAMEDPEGLDAAMDDVALGLPDFYAVAVTNASDRVLAARPSVNLDGLELAGASLEGRDYLQEARSTGVSVFGGFLLGRLGFRDPTAPGVVLAEPLFDARGGYVGALVGGLDTRSFHGDLAGAAPVGYHVTLMDSDRRVLDSSDPSLAPGTPLDQELRRSDGQVPTTPILGDGTRPLTFTYYPPPDGSLRSDLALDLVHATYRPVAWAGWGILVSLPTGPLYATFLPSVTWTLGLIGLAFGGTVVVALAFSARLTLPVRQGAAAAASIADEPFGPVDLSDVRSGGLQELDDLAAALALMRVRLQKRATAVRARQMELENQLVHAQKMEVIGHLAGGVAHDFNNILTPVLAHADLALEQVDDPDVADSLEQILAAAQRGRDITRQLLAHSRKQVLRMEALDLREEIGRGRRILESFLRDDVEMTLVDGDPVWPVHADATQIQQILMNLALNAQDAMAGGGRLDIRVFNHIVGADDGMGDDTIPAGRYVILEVEDSGQGMRPEVLERVFEPFFSTKEASRGTGLGLSTVYGIVRQHAGGIRVSSEPGNGTTFRLFFPVRDDVAE